LHVSAGLISLEHGGDLALARRHFPDCVEPLVDLSTGINPNAYPLPKLAPDSFARLPQPEALERLAAAAAAAYAAPSIHTVVPAPGTQILLPAIAALPPPGRAVVLGPTYAEHLRVASLVGHHAEEVADIGSLAHADLAYVVNPNNPDGRLLARDALLEIADELRSHGGILVVDEAFMDIAGSEMSLIGDVACGNIVVLRSFGKFFGLAGLRLGFALAAPELAARLKAWLGPWPVSGAAIAIGVAALADREWAQSTRTSLKSSAQRLDEILAACGRLEIVGGTSLFRLAHTSAATEIYRHLGRAGIFVRRFAEHPEWLRFGLPGCEGAWTRLRAALAQLA
jgi:cobalamin biosynthesis protein CobC